MNTPDALDHFDRIAAAREWLTWVMEVDLLDEIASVCVAHIVDQEVPGLADASFFQSIVGTDIALDKCNDAMIAVRSLLREDETPIAIGPWVVYLNDRGNPAYTPAIPARKGSAARPAGVSR